MPRTLRETRRERISRPGGLAPRLAALAILLVLGYGRPSFAGFTINAVYDSSITNDPNAATIQNTINSAIEAYQTRFADPITVNIVFKSVSSGLGGSSTFFGTTSYGSYRTALLGDETTADDATAFATLPDQSGNPANNNSRVALTTANFRALGFNVNPPSGSPDGTISLNTSIMNLDRNSINPSKYDLMAVAMHEIDEVLGIGSILNGLSNGAAVPNAAAWGTDLYRYGAPGVRSLSTGASTFAYFSIDGGVTNLARFNQTAGGDFSDFFSISAHTPQVQDAFGTPGATPNIGVELRILDVLGYDLLPAAVVPEPSSVALLGLGVGLVALRGLRRRA